MAVSDWMPYLAGTIRDAFKIRRANLDASALTAARTLAIPDKAGILALAGDARFSPALINGYLEVTASASALTIAVKNSAGSNPSPSNPVYIAFRNATETNGSITVLTIDSATSFTISSGSTLGLGSGIRGNIWVLGFNDGGTFRLGAVHCRKSYAANTFTFLSLAEDVLRTTTAEGGSGGADGAGVIYTGTAISTPAPMRVLGYISVQNTTAGTWISPNKVQPWYPGLPLPGQPVGNQDADTDNVMATGSNTIPADNSVPQASEANDFMAVSFTPTSAYNVLELEVQAQLYGAGDVALYCGIWQDSGSESLVGRWENTGASRANQQPLKAHLPATSTTARTYKVKAASHSGTVTFNGHNATAYYGGTVYSTFYVRELMG